MRTAPAKRIPLRIAAVAAMGGAMVAAQLGLSSAASAADAITVTSATVTPGGAPQNVDVTTKTDAPVTISVDGIGVNVKYQNGVCVDGATGLVCTPKNHHFSVSAYAYNSATPGTKGTVTAKSTDGTGSGTITVGPKKHISDVRVSGNYFQYDPSTGKVKDGIPVDFENFGPDAVQGATVTVTADQGIHWDGVPAGWTKVSDTKLSGPLANLAENGDASRSEVKIPSTISGKRQQLTVNVTLPNGWESNNPEDSTNVVLSTDFDVQTPTGPSASPSGTPSSGPTHVTPTPTSTTPGGTQLAHTGGDSSSATLIAGSAAALVVVGGAGILFARRRKGAAQA